MQFTFWCVLPNGNQNPIDTHNLFDAARRARSLGAKACFGKNPGTGASFSVSI